MAAAAASSTINPNAAAAQQQPGETGEAPNAARDGHPCGDIAPAGSDERRGGWPRGGKPPGLIPSFPN